ncbi:MULTISPECIES: thioredoxin [Thermus]|jgi:thioredoxin 2|uniref:Thioredoxin n=1 Tax=Thermus brockianus TaxID=56956 RepID=A0A1J0LTG8_THEBO|nr:thioredoxin [Thermus brockianus]APD08749.1 thioredoxin [Thermus brockianus]BDG15888.1 thiol reductase thioredoxin [Thermus brockianus]
MDKVVVCPNCGAKNRLRTPPPGQVPVCGACKAPLPWIVEADEKSFQEEVAGAPLVLVDFWAPWCGPCRMVAPVLEALAQEYAGKLKVVKVNTDENPGLAARYGVMSIPTLVLFQRGHPVATWVGASPKRVLEERLRPYVA